MKSNHSAPPRQSLRLFIGIRPDAATQHFLDTTVAHCQKLVAPQKTRWSSHSNRHLTLVFLGDTPADQLEKIEQTLQGIADSTSTLHGHIVSVHPFPKTRSKTLAAELLTNPELDKLQRKCRELTASIGKTPESTHYRPHFTLARNPNGFSRIRPIEVDYTAALNNLILYQSQLTPGGSQYTPIYETRLN